MIDLRWGLREESQDDHTIIEFCIREIENCKKSSLGPCFVVCVCDFCLQFLWILLTFLRDSADTVRIINTARSIVTLLTLSVSLTLPVVSSLSYSSLL